MTAVAQSAEAGKEVLEGILGVACGYLMKPCGIAVAACQGLFSRKRDNGIRYPPAWQRLPMTASGADSWR